MSYSINQYNAAGAFGPFAVTFPFISKAYVDVYVDGVKLTPETQYTWPTSSSVLLKVSGTTVVIKRNTPKDTRLVDFQDASILTEEALDLSAAQVFHTVQEALDDNSASLKVGSSGCYDASHIRIKNLGTPTESGDAIHKGYGDSFYGGAAAQEAALSAQEAALSAQEAALSAQSIDTTKGRLGYFLNVKEFGAVGDGVTDDTQAFRDAAVAAGNGVVIVPPCASAYRLTASVSYPASFLFLPGAQTTQSSGGFITGPVVDYADRDYECMMGMGNFNVWLEGTSFTNPPSNTFAASLWRVQYDGTAGSFSVDQAGGPLSVGAYNGIRWRQTIAGSGSTYRQLEFRVEDATTYNGGKATISFLAQCETGSTPCAAVVTQFFGTGGSPSTSVVALNQAFTATTSWQRFSFTFDMPSTSSKTFGSNIDDCLKVSITFPAVGVFNVALQELKLERGPIRTPFSAIPLSIQHAYVDRYLQFCVISIGDKATSAGEQVFEAIPFKMEMRKTPAITFDGTSLGGSTANLAGGITSNFQQKYGAVAYIQSAAAGTYYAIGQLCKLDARI